MEVIRFSLGEAFSTVGFNPTDEQWKVLGLFGYISDFKFSVTALEGIDAPPEPKRLSQPSKPSNEVIIERYLEGKHGIRVSHVEVKTLQDRARKLATTKSSKESTHEFMADWDPLAGKHGRQKSAIQAGNLATQRMAEANALSAEAASKLQELTQWTQFAITQEDFKEFKEQTLREYDENSALAKQRYEDENRELISARSQYNQAFKVARQQKIKDCAEYFVDWLKSDKYSFAKTYQEGSSASGFITLLTMTIEAALVIVTFGFALLLILPIHIWLLKDAFIGSYVIRVSRGLPRKSSLKPVWSPG